MNLNGFRAFVLTTGGLALLVLLGMDWDPITSLPARHVLGLGALVLLGVFSESLALTIVVGKNQGNSSVTFIPLFASILLFGPEGTVLFLLLSGGITELLVRRKEPIRAAFNVSQYVLSSAVAGFAYRALGGGSSPDVLHFEVLPFVAFAGVLLATNHVAVSLGISLNEGLPFRAVLLRLAGPWGTNLFYDLLVSPFALLVALGYVQVGVWGLVFVLFPLFFIRHSYFTNLRLQQANRDLLRALVKAIETRDPYTSGHSLRVSTLSRHIAEIMGLGRRAMDDIETAALLHDIGKIDVVYEEILRKPEHLSPEERAIIESHVTKGVALLESLSSFRAEVVDAVRYHHERFDGKGYPEGLVGRAAPVGARIIKIADAIDAMLSDRPYRKALSVSEVEEQLVIYGGTQFDAGIVDRILQSGVLQRHCAAVRGDTLKGESTLTASEGRARTEHGRRERATRVVSGATESEW